MAERDNEKEVHHAAATLPASSGPLFVAVAVHWCVPHRSAFEHSTQTKVQSQRPASTTQQVRSFAPIVVYRAPFLSSHHGHQGSQQQREHCPACPPGKCLPPPNAQSLTKLLMDMAPKAVKEVPLKQLMGRKLAIDASNFIYQVRQAGAPATVKDRTQHPWRLMQFLVAVRASDGDGPAQMLTNEAGEVTSHLQGMLSRTIRLLESGVKPLFVFDGKPPKMKEEEIAKRRAAREAAEKDMATAVESGTVADIEKFSKRTIVMTKQHQEDCKKLLALMGMPVVTAPCEAEAQCAELAAGGVVWGVAS
ncbi:FEN1, partial [Symbiodinium sp. KB8]